MGGGGRGGVVESFAPGKFNAWGYNHSQLSTVMAVV